MYKVKDVLPNRVVELLGDQVRELMAATGGHDRAYGWHKYEPRIYEVGQGNRRSKPSESQEWGDLLTLRTTQGWGDESGLSVAAIPAGCDGIFHGELLARRAKRH